MHIDGLVVSVNYSDLLAFTLRQNAVLFDRIILVTATFDQATKAVAAQYKNVELIETDVFYAGGATFNKFAAVELGTQQLNPDHLAFVFDADVLFPPNMSELLGNEFDGQHDPDAVYGIHRRQCDDYSTAWSLQNLHAVTDYSHSKMTLTPRDGWKNSESLSWLNDKEPSGYSLIFDPKAKPLQTRPWFGTNWKHSGGGDTDFTDKFPPEKRKWLESFWVVHLGQPHTNWYGRVTEGWGSKIEVAGPVTPAVARKQQEQLQQKITQRCRRIQEEKI